MRKGLSNSCGCSRESLGEQKIEKILKNNNIPYQKEYIDKKCKLSTGGYARFDFFINNSYYIEYDGIQHFLYRENESGWNTKEHLELTQKRDAEKNFYCLNNNIPIIRIPYTHFKNIELNDLLLQTSNFILKQEVLEK